MCIRDRSCSTPSKPAAVGTGRIFVEGVEHDVEHFAHYVDRHDHHCGVTDEVGHAYGHGHMHQHEPHAGELAHETHAGERRQLSLIGATTKYVEVLVVNDYARYQSLGNSIVNMADESAAMMNVVSQIYKSRTWNLDVTVEVKLVAQHHLIETDPWDAEITITGNSASHSSTRCAASATLAM